MKHGLLVVAVIASGTLLWNGCGKQEQTPPPAAPAPAAPAAVEKTAPPAAPAPAPAMAPVASEPSVVDLLASAKTGVENAMALAKDGKYQEALALLQQKATEVQANPEAKKLIDDAVAKIKPMMADAAAKALGGFGK